MKVFSETVAARLLKRATTQPLIDYDAGRV